MIAHAVVQYVDAAGVNRVAYRGDEIDLPAAEAERLTDLGAFVTVEAAPEPAVIEKVTPPATVKPVPRAASDKAAWVEYAAALGLHFSPDTDKQHIIDAVTAHTEGDDRA